MQGLLLVDKPAGWTSFDVVNYVRRMVATAEGKKPKHCKVGHTGTLDPFATGLLVLLIGKEYTKRAGELSKVDKTYEVTMTLGQTSTTGDPEGQITPYVAPELDRHPEHSEGPQTKLSDPPVISTEVEKSINRSLDNPGSSPGLRFATVETTKQAQEGKAVSATIPTREQLQAAVAGFRGPIQQVPPAFSAIKIDGQRAYKLAREGKEVVIEPRQVTINSLEVTDYTYPEVKLVADVSSGTYIRTLVEDIGKVLGTGAYTTQLRRTKVGTFNIADARTTEMVAQDLAAGLQTLPG